MRLRRAGCRGLAAASVALAAIPVAGLIDTPHAAATASIAAAAYWVKLGLSLPSVPKGGLLVGDDPTAAINPAQPPPPPVPLPVGIPPVNTPGPQLFGFTAVSALRIVGLPADTDVTLTLTGAPGSIPPLPGVSTIVACPIPNQNWAVPPGGAGDISQAPLANCVTPSVGRGGSVTSLSWLLPGDFQGSPGELDIELQPGAPSLPAPGPFLAAFNAPTSADLKAAPGGPVVSPPLATVPPEPAAAIVAPPAAPSVLSAPVVETPVESNPVPPAASSPAPGSNLPALNQLAGVSIPGVSDDRTHRIMAVALLFAIAVAWWWLGGRTARRPRRLGALAGEVAVQDRQEGGIGRFRRPRGSRPPRL